MADNSESGKWTLKDTEEVVEGLQEGTKIAAEVGAVLGGAVLAVIQLIKLFK